jgi:hypothetical protein
VMFIALLLWHFGRVGDVDFCLLSLLTLLLGAVD